MAKPAAGIQMYALRDEAERDLLRTLEKVAEFGYKAVEIVGYFNSKPKQLKQKAEELGLAIPSVYVPLNFKALGSLEKDFMKDLKLATDMGVAYAVVPWVPVHERPKMDEIRFVADILIRCGEHARKENVKLALHPHVTDMRLVEGKPAYDRLLELVPPELMAAELDLGWVFMAGYDPGEYLERHKTRTPLIHIRDFTEGRLDTELGRGVIGCDKLLEKVEQAEVSYMFVEQERFLVSSLESAKLNRLYLMRMGYS